MCRVAKRGVVNDNVVSHPLLNCTCARLRVVFLFFFFFFIYFFFFLLLCLFSLFFTVAACIFYFISSVTPLQFSSLSLSRSITNGKFYFVAHQNHGVYMYTLFEEEEKKKGVLVGGGGVRERNIIKKNKKKNHVWV